MGTWFPLFYFTAFLIFGTIMLLNLLVGAVIMTVTEAKEENSSGEILYLEITKCSDLIAADPGLGLGLGTSDPYVVITLGDQKRKTKVVKRTLNPEFREVFRFWPYEKMTSSILDITVYDWDMFSLDDTIGQVLLDTKNIPYNENYEFECALNGVEHGKIHLNIFKSREEEDGRAASFNKYSKISADIKEAQKIMGDVRKLLQKRNKLGIGNEKNNSVSTNFTKSLRRIGTTLVTG
jgi:Ca2+-dependent lipid-binding protein